MDTAFVTNVDAPEFICLTAEDAGIESVEGELEMRFHELRDDGHVWAGIVTIVKPVTLHYLFKGDETVHIMQGEASITIDEEQTVHLCAGDVASFVKGARSKWVIKTPFFRELFVLTRM